jgi:hypothetical protein
MVNAAALVFAACAPSPEWRPRHPEPWPEEIVQARFELSLAVEEAGLAESWVVDRTLDTPPIFRRELGPVKSWQGGEHGAITEGLRGYELIRYAQVDGWCLQDTYIVHELLHVMLWRLLYSPDKEHKLGPWWAAAEQAENEWRKACQ